MIDSETELRLYRETEERKGLQKEDYESDYSFFSVKEKIGIGRPCFICKNGNISNKQYWRDQRRKFIGISDKTRNNKIKVKIQGQIPIFIVKEITKVKEIHEQLY